MLRDVLRLHPRLAAPEETHFFRWVHPFGTNAYHQQYANNRTLQKHRTLDGVDDETFFALYEASGSRRALQDRYMEEYLRIIGKPEARWFDKTPQNVYGILLLSAQYPEATFIHIHRHPLNVVSSLKEGKVMSPHTVPAGIITWLESIQIMQEFTRSHPDRVLTVAYERLTSNPERGFWEVLEFLGENPELLDLERYEVRPERNRYRKILTPDEIALVRERCSSVVGELGYVE